MRDVTERISSVRRAGHASGDSAFAANLHATAILLPLGVDDPPLAIGVLYPREAAVDPQALVSTLQRGIAQSAVSDTYEQLGSAPERRPLTVAV